MARDNASSGKSLNRVDYCGVIFVNRGEWKEARVAHRHVVYYSEAIDCSKRGGEEGQSKGSGVEVRCIYGFNDGIF